MRRLTRTREGRRMVRTVTGAGGGGADGGRWSGQPAGESSQA